MLLGATLETVSRSKRKGTQPEPDAEPTAEPEGDDLTGALPASSS
jgi:hypothetical protein